MILIDVKTVNNLSLIYSFIHWTDENESLNITFGFYLMENEVYIKSLGMTMEIIWQRGGGWGEGGGVWEVIL